MNILQISFHTAPMNNLGENDGGGLSVYVEAISKELAKEQLYTRHYWRGS
jgi:hypothetical protein